MRGLLKGQKEKNGSMEQKEMKKENKKRGKWGRRGEEKVCSRIFLEIVLGSRRSRVASQQLAALIETSN